MFKLWRNTLLTVLLQVVVSAAYASDWGLFGDQDKLKNHTIADVGNISKITPPYGATWDIELYKLNNRCLGISGYSKPTMYSSTAAMLLIDNSKNVKLAILENSISIEVKLFPVSVYKCPYGTTPAEQLESAVKQSQRSQEQFKAQLEALKKQQEEYKLLQEKLKKLKEQ